MAVGLGIDIGAHSIKLVQVRLDGGGRLRVTGALRLEHGLTASASAGPVDLPPALATQIRDAKLARSGVLGISGRDLILRYAVVPPAPPWRLKEIMKFEIEQSQVGEAGDLCSDYRILAVPGSGLNDQLVTLVAVAKTPYINGLLNQVQAATLSARHCTPNSVALFQAYRRSELFSEDETVFLLDVGHDKIEMAISAGGGLVFARSMPGGGRKFTEALNKLLKTGMDQAAEYLRRRAVLPAAAPGPDDKQGQALFNALRGVADQLVSAVNNGVRFCQAQTKAQKLQVDRIVLSGGGGRLQGLPEYLAKRLGKPVVPLAPSEGLQIDPQAAPVFGEAAPEMAVALGLAICDADAGAFALELVPEAVLRRRRFLHKTLFGYAAALVLAGLGGLMYLNAANTAQEALRVTREMTQKKEKLSKREKAYRELVEKNVALRKQLDMLRRETRFGLAAIEFLAHLRKVTPNGVSITSMAPAETDSESFAARFRLILTGQADTKKLPKVHQALKEFMDRLKEHAVVRDADVTMGVEGSGRRNKKQPRTASAGKAFSFTVELRSGLTSPAAADEEAGE